MSNETYVFEYLISSKKDEGFVDDHYHFELKTGEDLSVTAQKKWGNVVRCAKSKHKFLAFVALKKIVEWKPKLEE